MTNAAGPVQALNAKAPEWVHLVPAGTFKGMDGRGPYHANAAELVVKHAARSTARPLLIDFAHQTYAPSSAGAAGAAAGWIVELQARADGLWGRVEWTPAGRKAIEDKEYRYLSPVYSHQAGSGEVTALLGAALVNNPNLTNLTPVLNSKQASGESEPVTIRQLLRGGRDQSAPELDTLLAEFGLPAPETQK